MQRVLMQAPRDVCFRRTASRKTSGNAAIYTITRVIWQARSSLPYLRRDSRKDASFVQSTSIIKHLRSELQVEMELYVQHHQGKVLEHVWHTDARPRIKTTGCA